MSIKAAAIIVVYNKEVPGSIAYQNMESISPPNTEIIVVDNSTIETGNQKFCDANGIQYISMHGNKGLAKAYNMAIGNVGNAASEDLIILLDDDTNITKEYFDKLFAEAYQDPDIDIFAPIVYGQDARLRSPNEFNAFKLRCIKTPDQEIRQERFNAIGSGLAIRKRVFDNYRFNETLFVDCVDHCFLYEQRQLGRKFKKIDAEIHQNFSFLSPSKASDKGWKRLRLRIEDTMRFARILKKPKYWIMELARCCGSGVVYGIRVKSIGVLYKSICFSLYRFFAELYIFLKDSNTKRMNLNE